MVQVEVGPEMTMFHIHKRLLSDASPYFRAALGGGYKEVRKIKAQFIYSTYTDTTTILQTW